MIARAQALSITHKLGSEDDAKLDVDEAGHTSPDHHVAGRRIAAAGQIASQLCEFDEVVRECACAVIRFEAQPPQPTSHVNPELWVIERAQPGVPHANVQSPGGA